MIIDISNEILTRLKTDIPTATVLSSDQSSSKTYPLIIVTDAGNSSNLDTKDSSGFKHNVISFNIDIFTIGDTKMSDAKSLRNSVDSIMNDDYGMNRDFSDEIPNYLDSNIYRYTLKYSCVIDSNKIIYGR